ncbi:hypothetical protein IEQ34_023156 [Dendrobium chrysotoxum]|uniref:Uncharacterized protein n=1 Tax=Dendrobium chrysotoxum TaxID=161865 RepID=A0AAV7FZ43_DENCH|nr:hypothetical protein IEQ34_023156 [Dendrobium chrysotoxum]
MSFALLLAPVGLLLLIRLVDFVDTSGLFCFIVDITAALFHCFSPLDCRHHLWRLYDALWPEEGNGSSPWGVAAAVVLLIVLASFHSTFVDMWGP